MPAAAGCGNSLRGMAKLMRCIQSADVTQTDRWQTDHIGNYHGCSRSVDSVALFPSHGDYVPSLDKTAGVRRAEKSSNFWPK